ncbi:MAG: extracellular solute-binding protein [Candidatus Wallbacteria bacterium]|nr:extracellular solute-binding protein [Candidatus Wallbacteria bacterium]
MKHLHTRFLTFLILALLTGCGSPEPSLTIFYAGSLARPMKDLVEKFQLENPGLKVNTEASGSRACCWKVLQLKRKADLILSADYLVIEDLLMPNESDWYVIFAGNRMVIAYTEHSKFGSEITEQNWLSVLTSAEIKVGHSDQNLDPDGYRAILCWKLADNYYKEQVKGKLSEALSRNCPAANIRPMSIELVALLQNYALDYAFLYESIAMQHKLKYLNLPDEINLGSSKFNEFYACATIEITGKTPDTISIMKGTEISYAATIPKSASNPKLALMFMEFLLSDEGKQIIERNHQNPFRPCIPSDKTKIPAELLKYCGD